MTPKNFSFWFCTLLSGIVIGIASQQIPAASANCEVCEGLPQRSYAGCFPHRIQLPNQYLSEKLKEDGLQER